MAIDEEDWVPIAALQHYAYCPRQWGLIHLEGVWADNQLTAEGSDLHNRVDTPCSESRGRIRVARAVPLRSRRLGLTGKADVVEFQRLDDPGDADGVRLDGSEVWWAPIPVEYKRGAPKPWDCDAVQVCAQALCLEEMLDVVIREGAIFYGETRRRIQILLDEPLRARTVALATQVHGAARSGDLPDAVRDARCRRCSLRDLCLPDIGGHSGARVASYLARSVRDACEDAQ